MAFDAGRKPILRSRLVVGCNARRLGELGIDYRSRDRFLRIESGEPAGEIFKLAHIAGPTVVFEPIERGLVELLGRQAFALDLGEEVPDQIGHVVAALAQRRQPQRHHV